MFFSVTFAPTTTPWLASVTTPVTLEEELCARGGLGNRQSATNDSVLKTHWILVQLMRSITTSKVSKLFVDHHYAWATPRKGQATRMGECYKAQKTAVKNFFR
jgi:hypothetical protein